MFGPFNHHLKRFTRKLSEVSEPPSNSVTTLMASLLGSLKVGLLPTLRAVNSVPLLFGCLPGLTDAVRWRGSGLNWLLSLDAAPHDAPALESRHPSGRLLRLPLNQRRHLSGNNPVLW